jgi:ATP-binding cassette subfamily F protein 3
LELRKERREQELAAYENQQKQIKQTEEFIDRFRAKATKAVQVQSRIKALDRMDKIEIEEEDTAAMRFSFPPAPHSGKVSLEVKSVTKKYDDNTVFSNVDFLIERGEKVSFVGKNGEGKSTMSRLIVGDEKTTSGEIKPGYQVKIGYYAQNQAEILNPEKTVFEVIDEAAAGEIRKRVRSLLGSFLFSGEEVDKKVKVLSGGERARLAMCKLLLEPVNLLILDEPTNHLDIRSKEILKDALLRYDGTLIVISHDRDFLNGLTEKIFEFTSGKVKEHLSGINEFLRSKQAADVRTWEASPKAGLAAKEKGKSQGVNSSKESNQSLSYEENKQLKKDHKKQKNKVAKLEAEISRLETKLEEYNELLKAPDAYTKPENKSIIDDWEKVNSQLEKAMQDWENAQLEFEELEGKL